MDRYDERKPVSGPDDQPADERPAGEAREGDVLGLGGAPVPKEPGDPVPDDDPDSVARRRQRASGLDEPGLSDKHEHLKPGPGATGIDMGAGGEGTGVKTDKG